MPTAASGARTIPAGRASATTLQAGILALIAWFAWPTLGGEYNEGFQSMIVLNARGLLDGRRAGMDLLYPLDNDFFLNSRLGISLVLAPLLHLGLPAVTAFRLVMALSLAGLLGANSWILVRCYRVHPVLALLPPLLMPGLFESAWFFNDNVLSAALSTASLAVFWTAGLGRARTMASSVLSGILWGLAIMCRTDAVLLGPAFAVLVLFDVPDWPARLRHGLLAGAVAVCIPLLGYAAVDLSLFDVFSLTRRATEAWARKDPLTHMLHPILKGIAYPGMLAIAAGVVTVIARRQWREVLLCLVVPLVYAAAYGRMLTEVRYLVPLTPFICILMVHGTRAVLAARPLVRQAWLAAVGVAVLSCFLPPMLLPMPQLWFLSTDNDMIRPSVGRIWSPVLGASWNHMLEEGVASATDALERTVRPGGAGVVVSTRWTPDRLVALALLEHGFAGTRAREPAACREIGEVFTRGPERILHLRAHIPMLPTERAAVTWRALGAPCLDAMAVPVDARILVVGQMVLHEPPPALHDPGVTVVLAPGVDPGWSQDIVGKSYVTYVATVPRDDVVKFLAEPKTPAEAIAAEASIARRTILQ